ncbi:uncharacterized protein LOC127808474 [Diospyros lotus]|uniref:uncharacterized protein LOC127808474 n=1 Tax=Diospyros lotus TaxID=55363 RepID=UPI002252E4C5|nr:uncharacterized protein LOC127808474 [Diospyros lotus]
MEPRHWNTRLSVFLVLVLHFVPFSATADHEVPSTRSTIIFSSLDRSNYYFDVYTLPIAGSGHLISGNELKITDGHSANFNGHFPSSTSLSALLSSLPDQTLAATPDQLPLHLVYVTERNGSSSIYLDVLYSGGSGYTRRRSTLQVPNRVQVPLVGIQQSNGLIGIKDRPSLVGDYLVYVSTHENSGVPRMSWAAVYSTHLRTGSTRRLTPYGQADYSPAASPSGVWTAVASSGEKEWTDTDKIHDSGTDIYIFRTQDGSDRVKVVEHGGWPSWADESTLYFHRKSSDGWWSVYKASLPKSGRVGVGSVVTQRVTPPGIHAFTPAASVANKNFIALATRRPDSEQRHIELFNVISKEFVEVTRPISPGVSHYNPFLSLDSTRIGYHRCRARDNGRKGDHLLLEKMQSPLAGVDMFRVDGFFSSFSPEGDRIAYSLWPYHTGLYVVNRDGSGLRKLLDGKFKNRLPFGTVWDPKRKGILHTNIGPAFGAEKERVDVISINVDDEDELNFKNLTTGGDNNALPAPSPDGKWLVFRSGRSGHKNLYIMDAVEGEKGGLQRLTNGPWLDTMPYWSPDGDWIVFSSDRDSPGSDSFALYLIHPNGTGLTKLFYSGPGGRANHAWFSPDSKRIVFSADHAGMSAEPISYPENHQPYGELFSIGVDGTGLTRLTHNPYEDGTPTWSSIRLSASDVKHPIVAECSFMDCIWLDESLGLSSVSSQTRCTQ